MILKLFVMYKPDDGGGNGGGNDDKTPVEKVFEDYKKQTDERLAKLEEENKKLRKQNEQSANALRQQLLNGDGDGDGDGDGAPQEDDDEVTASVKKVLGRLGKRFK